MSAPSQPHDTRPGPFLEGGAWRWLLDLRSRLNILVEVVDERGQLLLPPVRSEGAMRFRAALSEVNAVALAAATRRVGSHDPVVPGQIDGMLFVAFLLEPERRLRLVVAEPSGTAQGRGGQELAGVGEWLARSIESERSAQPGHPTSADSSDWHELAVIHRLLNQAASGGSARELVRLVVEAMAIWSDADVRAYVGDLSGEYRLDVALASADASSAPAKLGQHVSTTRSVERAAPARAADLGFSVPESIAIARVDTSRTAPWLLVHLGPLDPRAEVRLAAFAEVLGPRLDAAAEVEASRLLWAMMQRLMVSDATAPGAGLSAALRELADIIPGEAALRITGPGDRLLLEAGDSELARDHETQGWESLRVPLRGGALCRGVLSVRTSFGQCLTLREQHLASVAGSVLQTWLDGVLAKGLLLIERRQQRATSFDDLLALALDTPQDDRVVSLLILASTPEQATGTDSQDALAELRRHLRPFDAVGTLASGDIGVWLPGATREHAARVRARLRSLFDAPSIVPSLRRAAIGLATSAWSLARAADLIAAARGDLASQALPGAQ